MSARSDEDRQALARWRLVLGRQAESHSITCGGDGECARVERLVGFLFGEGEGAGQSGRGGGRQGGRGAPQLSVPDWVDQVAELFPRQAREVMERELIQRRGIQEILEKPELLERVEPSVE